MYLQALVADIDARKATSLPSLPMAATTISYLRTVSIAAALQVSLAATSYSQTGSESGGSLIVSTQIASQKQAILLKKSDRILFGTVRVNGSFYEIDIADQSRVSIPRDQVDFIGASAEEVYQHKCRNITRWKTGDHFQITRWCLQNRLLLHAINHFEEVEKQSPNHPAVKQLSTEVQQKILGDEKFRAFVGLPIVSSAQTTKALPAKAAADVSLVSVNSQATEHPQIAIYFNDRVQPILMNRCSQAACHGASSNNSLRLIEPRGTNYARVSSENLKLVLASINPDESGTPKLLTYATKPHGPQRHPGISLNESALIEELKNWIRFSQNPVIPALASQSVSAQGLGAQGSVPTIPNAPSKLNPLSPGSAQLRSVPGSNNQVDFPEGVSRPTTSEIDALDAQLNQILAKEKSFPASSRDPFDPAEFNRQAAERSSQPR